LSWGTLEVAGEDSVRESGVLLHHHQAMHVDQRAWRGIDFFEQGDNIKGKVSRTSSRGQALGASWKSAKSLVT